MNTVVALMYHDVFNLSVTESGFQNIGAIKYKISRQSFEDQIKTISNYCEKQQINKESICLTFDDGGISFLTIIAPILEKYGFKGYFFISTKLINAFGFLTAKNIVELDVRGHIIGTHSHSHPKNISELSYWQIKSEWVESTVILKAILKKSIEHASIPGGFFSSASEKALFSIGVNVIFTSNPTSSIKFVNSKMIIGRYCITQGMASEVIVNLLKPFSLSRIMFSLRWKA